MIVWNHGAPRILVRAFAGVLALLSMAPATAAPERLVREIVLIRHGIRAPTKPPAALAAYADQPWPAWPVAPGQLTRHGGELMRALGDWYRGRFAADGIVSAGCGDGTFAVIADSTPRNRASAAALTAGLRPGCATRFRAFPAGRDDPLFRGMEHGGDDPADDTVAAMPHDRLVELQQVLLGCHDEGCLGRAGALGKRILLDEPPAKALKQAGSLAENLMLAYAEGFPLAQVGWGRLDAAGIGRLMTLHNASFAFAKKTQASAARRGGTMLAHIAATLAAAAGVRASSASALIGADTRALVLVGHDTDLASQAGLLGLDWHAPAQPDDYPPGGALIYRLLDRDGRYMVQLDVALPTLAALRAGKVARPGAMDVRPVTIGACGDRRDCPLDRFLAAVARAVPASARADGAGIEPDTR